ncbi:MAG: DUF349 domain-containing protein [Dysgonamonadaceae bacterium]|jgi:hypothetical protein|nr:DUF349 domain-containing protein [Dysgonamonadaceae bacterium]
MNEVLDSKFSAEKNQSEENNLQENAENKVVEQTDIAVENAVIPEEISVTEVLAEATGDLSEEKDKAEKRDSEDSEDLTLTEISEKLTKRGIIDRIKELVVQEVDAVKDEIDTLKQNFYKQRRNETEESKKQFVESGGEESEFQAPKDELEDELKVLLFRFKERKSKLQIEEDQLKEANLEQKKAILEELKRLTESQGDFNKIYSEYRHLQQRWKELKLVPQWAGNELWKEYQRYNEIFYDLVKINNELREYDFKKNLDLKLALCEAVEQLGEEEEILPTFHRLQKLHQEWREIGPVSKELRNEVWNRFKQASSVINKKHQDFYEKQRSDEQTNLQAKITICEKVESINYDELTGFRKWDEKNKYVISLQKEWKTIGFAPKKSNVRVFERFRTACDVFFRRKSEFYRQIKDSLEVNLEKKRALCEKAEALQDSTDWKEAGNQLIALQKEWKTIGAVARRHSDVVWNRFIAACDHFFEQKNKHTSSHKLEETDNLRLKNEVIDKINAINESTDRQEASETFHQLVAEWNAIGFVPFKEKDAVNKKYREAVDKYFDRLKVDKTERKLQTFKSTLGDFNSDDKSKSRMLGERDRLMRSYEKLKSEIQIYENNIGFLSVSSKGGGGLREEMNRKIDKLKSELDLAVKKIQAIDDNIDGK